MDNKLRLCYKKIEEYQNLYNKYGNYDGDRNDPINKRLDKASGEVLELFSAIHKENKEDAKKVLKKLSSYLDYSEFLNRTYSN